MTRAPMWASTSTTRRSLTRLWKVECYFTTGKYDMFVKLYAHNNDHLLSLIHNKFLQLGLGRTETLITFKEVFKRQIPIAEDDE